MPLVSVIIPTYNRLKFLDEAIRSVLAQTYQNIEIIVVDDGSILNVNKAIKAYKNKIRYIYQKNSGLSAARNKGIINSSGEYLAFLDDDDIFEPRKLEIQTAILRKFSEVGFVYSDYYIFQTDYRDQLELSLATGRNIPATEFAKSLFLNPNVAVPTVLIRRTCFKKVGLFNESLYQHEDGDMFLRIALHWKIKFSDYPSARVRYHANKMSMDRIGIYSSIINSSNKILASYPEFKAILGDDANRRFADLHFKLGTAYLDKHKLNKSIVQFKLSHKLDSRSITVRTICIIVLKLLLKSLFR